MPASVVPAGSPNDQVAVLGGKGVWLPALLHRQPLVVARLPRATPITQQHLPELHLGGHVLRGTPQRGGAQAQ